MGDQEPPCKVPSGTCVPLSEVERKHCYFEPGSCFYFNYQDSDPPVDDNQIPLSSEMSMSSTAQPSSSPVPPQSLSAAVTAAPPPVVPSLPLPEPVPTVGVPTVGVPTPNTAANELSQFSPSGGMTSVLLAAIAVAGGGAAWKFYAQRSKEKHEEELKRIELQANSQSDQSRKCDAASTSLATRCDELEKKLSEMKSLLDQQGQANKDASLSGLEVGSKVESLEDKVVALEKAIKRVKKVSAPVPPSPVRR